MNEWIKLSEKLPKNGSRVLINSRSVERLINHIDIVGYDNNLFFNEHNDEIIIIEDCYWSITHWMYLPESPIVIYLKDFINKEIILDDDK